MTLLSVFRYPAAGTRNRLSAISPVLALRGASTDGKRTFLFGSHCATSLNPLEMGKACGATTR
jgi:hypothetical protein